MAFFAIGGYTAGIWLMYARTVQIVVAALSQGSLRATLEEVRQGIATQIFGVVGASDFPPIGHLPIPCRCNWPLLLCTGCGAGAVWLARVPQAGDRRVSLDSDPCHDAGADFLLFQNHSGPRGAGAGGLMAR